VPSRSGRTGTPPTSACRRRDPGPGSPRPGSPWRPGLECGPGPAAAACVAGSAARPTMTVRTWRVSLPGLRATAGTSWPAATPCSRSCRPTPPAAVKMVSFICWLLSAEVLSPGTLGTPPSLCPGRRAPGPEGRLRALFRAVVRCAGVLDVGRLRDRQACRASLSASGSKLPVCIHNDLRRHGFPGCAVYDCFSAGQQVSQVTFAGGTVAKTGRRRRRCLRCSRSMPGSARGRRRAGRWGRPLLAR